MNKLLCTALISTVLPLIVSCNSVSNKSTVGMLPGTVVDSFSVPVKEDTLNNSVFMVKIVADSAVDKGVYIADVTFGNNTAQGKFTMPKGIEHVTPVLRPGSAPYTGIVGFRLEKDTSFYDYFEITCNKQNTRMGYINSYTFE
ncbi:MAG: hypothetical protein JNM41_02480 [Flavipsychrobacter sp.]|nr:hypothetical protein [Flavipsychrobacter sp.]